MAEVLSVVASVIAIYQIAERLSQLLSKAKHLSQAPSEVFALNNEISDLTVTLQNLEQCLLSCEARMTAVPGLKIQHVSALVERAKRELLALEQLMHQRFLRSGMLQGDFKVFRLQWIRARPMVESHRQALREIRENIVIEVQAVGM